MEEEENLFWGEALLVGRSQESWWVTAALLGAALGSGILLEGRGKQGSLARDGKGQLSVCLTSLFRAGFWPGPVAWRGRAQCFKCCLTQQCAMCGTF